METHLRAVELYLSLWDTGKVLPDTGERASS